MKHSIKYLTIEILSILLMTIVTSQIILANQSGKAYRRSSIHNGNLVRTVFGNWGVIGQPREKGPRGAWLFDTNGYIGDVSPMVGAEVNYHSEELDSTITFHSVVVCPVDRPATAREESPTGDQWTFEPVSGYFNESSQGIAMSTDRNSWPPYWPDKMDDPEDPGWPEQWNGFFGKGVTNADQESYFIMDDNNDVEFNSGHNLKGVYFKPDNRDANRNGLGLEVKVRGMQWAQFLAQDVIFWLYEITNTSTTDYDKVVFGMIAGTYNGVTGTDDSPQEYDDDYSFFDVERDLTYTGDYPNNNSRNPKWQGPVGLVGYAFLESPGNPYDGIDNDGDNKPEEHPGKNLIFTAPLFTESDFDSVVYNKGDQIVLIDKDYKRTFHTITSDTETVVTKGMQITIIAGQTKLVEGNVLANGSINPNVYDGIDNDLDGLIDENYLLHYRQRRVDQNGVVLFDTLNPVAYKDYRRGLGIDDPLIDEARNDGLDNDGDWNPETDDVGNDGKPGTNDYGENDGKPTANEPNFDKTDVDESDQIGLTSFNYFVPSNAYPMADDELLWEWLKPGYFDVPSSIQNGKPVAGEDGDFIYGSGYFPLRAGDTQRFSLALVYGYDLTDLLKNRETVQDIYNSDYRFPQPPDKPTVTAVAGDGKVTLYWDRKAEESIDPVTKEKDFEGYKIYKATDPDFNDVFVITDANGVLTGYKPLAQFDKVNGIKGIFEASSDLYQSAGGYSYYLGSDNGLVHSYVDEDVQNGRIYYYAVVAYDHGDASNDIFPSENTKFISVQSDGTVITDINTVQVRPTAKVAGYDEQNSELALKHLEGPATGVIQYKIIDETLLNGHTYKVNFTDTRTDGIDNDDDWNYLTCDVGSDGKPGTNDYGEGDGIPTSGEPNFEWNDEDEFAQITSTYSVLDKTGVEEFINLDTSYVWLTHQNIQYDDILIASESDPNNYLSLSKFEIDTLRGKIKIKAGSNLKSGSYRIFYKYYPVFKSPNIQYSPYMKETKDSDIFDGVELVFSNPWDIKMIKSKSGWNSTDRIIDFTFRIDQALLEGDTIVGVRYPGIYELRVGDSSEVLYETPTEFLKSIYPSFPDVIIRTLVKKTNFYLFNVLDSVKIPFLYNGGIKNSYGIYEITPGGLIESYIPKPDSTYQYSWVINFPPISDKVTPPRFLKGDILHIETEIPFRNGDTYEFTTEIPNVDDEVAKSSLDDIQVVPNPYVVANTMESPLPPAITSGRGERRIEFRKLPNDAKVHIFTSAGAHVITLNHNGNIHNGTLAWNVKSKENLDVAFGVYYYIIESSVGKKSGKLAVIK